MAPPYDVLSDAQVDELQARSPHNITYIDIPRGGDDRYEHAAKVLRSWCDEGVLVRTTQPSFTIYRLRFVDATGTRRDIAGVLGGLEVVDEGAGGVLPARADHAEGLHRPAGPDPGHREPICHRCGDCPWRPG